MGETVKKPAGHDLKLLGGIIGFIVLLLYASMIAYTIVRARSALSAASASPARAAPVPPSGAPVVWEFDIDGVKRRVFNSQDGSGMRIDEVEIDGARYRRVMLSSRRHSGTSGREVTDEQNRRIWSAIGKDMKATDMKEDPWKVP